MLAIGTVLNTLIAEESLLLARSNWKLASSDNAVSQVFAYQGNELFLALFSGLFLAKAALLVESRQSQRNSDSSILTSILSVKNAIFAEFVKTFARFTIKVISLLYLFKLIDYVFLETGGSCLIDQTVANALAASALDYDQCFKYNGTWVRFKDGFCSLTPGQFSKVIKSAEVCRDYGQWTGGFDISGHFCFLTTLSLIIFNELEQFHQTNHTHEAENFPRTVNGDWLSITFTNFWLWLSMGTLFVWASILLITSIFYHSFLEKAAGLLFGYVAPIIMYIILPYIPVWRKLHE